MNSEYVDYMQDIFDAMVKAENFVNGLDYAAFEADDKTVFAVLRALEVVGEATKRIPDDIRNRYPQIPWRAMAGMRDRLIHGYHEVNLSLVWETVNERIPQLKPLFEHILKENRP